MVAAHSRSPNALPVAGLVESVRRMVCALHGARIRRSGVDLDDVVQDVLLRMWEAQSRAASRYDPARGMSVTTYAYVVTRTAGVDSLRRHERWAHDVPASSPEADLCGDGARPRMVEAARWHGAPSLLPEPVGPALTRLLSCLDLDEEREMATHLAAGCSVAEAGRRMGMTESATVELGTRVRALLLPATDG